MIEFSNQEEEYLRWVAQNAQGFVLNCERQPRPSYLILHRASCTFIRSPKWKNYTTGDYTKVCSLDREELERWARRKIGGEPSACSKCNR
jgi:hypothetical protein